MFQQQQKTVHVGKQLITTFTIQNLKKQKINWQNRDARQDASSEASELSFHMEHSAISKIGIK